MAEDIFVPNYRRNPGFDTHNISAQNRSLTAQPTNTESPEINPAIAPAFCRSQHSNWLLNSRLDSHNDKHSLESVALQIRTCLGY